MIIMLLAFILLSFLPFHIHWTFFWNCGFTGIIKFGGKKQGAPTTKQWVKNLIAIAQVTEEVQVWCPASCSGFKGSSIVAAAAQNQCLPGNFHKLWVHPFKKGWGGNQHYLFKFLPFHSLWNPNCMHIILLKVVSVSVHRIPFSL